MSALIELVGRTSRALLERQCPERFAQRRAAGRRDRRTELGRPDRRRSSAVGEAGGRFGRACCTSFPVSAGSCRPAPRSCASKVTPWPRSEGGNRRVALRVGTDLDEDLAYGFRLPGRHGRTVVVRLRVPRPDHRGAMHRPAPRRSSSTCWAGDPRRRLRDDRGTVRVTIPTLDWDGYVHLAFDEIRLAGASSPQIARRLRAALDDLLDVAPADRRPPLLRQLALLDEAVHRSSRQPSDVALRDGPDSQGIGSPHLELMTLSLRPTTPSRQYHPGKLATLRAKERSGVQRDEQTVNYTATGRASRCCHDGPGQRVGCGRAGRQGSDDEFCSPR